MLLLIDNIFLLYYQTKFIEAKKCFNELGCITFLALSLSLFFKIWDIIEHCKR